ncbi:hypothetical protein [Methanosarcina siciliae]|uniref:hypothetical protein n=1 Tax=Methanosarcina siciliae TaxID=38027 RepID=UPI000AF3FD0D|nr:hypothetical protein [Methanosarcina siciliae]
MLYLEREAFERYKPKKSEIQIHRRIRNSISSREINVMPEINAVDVINGATK